MISKIAPLMLVAFLFAGCKHDNDKFHNKAIEPSIAGVWAGNVKINDVNSAVHITIQQNNVSIQGTYTADGASPVLGNSGTVVGATTGPTFSLNVNGAAPACIQTLQMGGANSGSELSFNLTGTDCDGVTLRGESFLTKT